jgi:Spy/CpxP family protein refolding chaperone
MIGGNVKQKAALWVGVVFALGLILGGVLGYTFSAKSRWQVGPPMNEQAHRAHIVEELTKELALTPDQANKLDTVLTQTQAKFKAVHEADEPQLEAIRKTARSEIRAFLTPEQVPKFEEHIRKLDEERKKRAEK